MVTVERDGAYLIFKREGVEFYDTAIPAQADVGRLIRHLGDKMWFSSVRTETLQLILDALEEVA
ncbi:MAG: hypothetical protein QG592_1821 [Pseudomonadota bacterium]|nr:hypothetical protein [Pseudomonadota bacterium]